MSNTHTEVRVRTCECDMAHVGSAVRSLAYRLNRQQSPRIFGGERGLADRKWCNGVSRSCTPVKRGDVCAVKILPEPGARFEIFTMIDTAFGFE